MAKILIVINPVTSAGDPGALARAARRQLVGHVVQVFVPQSPREFADLAAILEKYQSDFIVVVGGDGTTNSLLNGLIKATLPVYFYAGGTANDLAKQVGHVPSWKAVGDAVASNRTEALDVVKLNDSLFVTVGGLGVGAVLTKMMNDRRTASPVFKSLTRVMSQYTYTALALQVIAGLQYEPKDFEIVIDGSRESFRSACILVANQPFLGGDIQVCADAKNNDGIGNLLILRDTSRLGLLTALGGMLRGKLPADAVIRSFRSAILRTCDDSAVLFFGDGESICHGKSFQMDVIPGALNFLQSRKEA